MVKMLAILIGCALAAASAGAQDKRSLMPGSDRGVGAGILAEALAALDARNYRKAIRLHKVAIRDYGLGPVNRGVALNNICISYTALGELDTALGYCDRAIKVSSSKWSYYNNRANVYLGKKMFDRAIADYGRSLEIFPDSEITRNNLAISVRRQKAMLPEPRPNGES